MPGPFDRDPFKVIEQDPTFIHCRSEFTVTNYAGTPFVGSGGQNRTFAGSGGCGACPEYGTAGRVRWVGYSSENGVQNTGEAAWTAEQGQPSVWILDMFPPAENGRLSYLSGLVMKMNLEWWSDQLFRRHSCRSPPGKRRLSII